MLIRCDRTHGGLIARLAIENHFHQVVIFHTKLFSQVLTWCLIFCTQDDSAQIKKNCADAHLPFFFPRPRGVLVAGGLLPNSARAAGCCPIWRFEDGLACVSPLIFDLAGTGSGWDSVGLEEAPSDVRASTTCWGFSFNSTSSFFSSSFQFGMAVSKR